MFKAPTRVLRRSAVARAPHVKLADFSEATLSPRNGEPIANGARDNAYDLAVAGPLVV